MLGTVDTIDYDGDRVRRVVLRFPDRSGPSDIIREVTTCEHIGQGSFGTVYSAVCDHFPHLALKISTGKTSRLRQELDVLSKTCTQGRLLLPRFEFGALNKAGDLIVIAMELCVPRTLHDLLLATRIPSEPDMLFLAYQATLAVAYVHEEGCIHRDIKLQNYVFDTDGNLKLIDFGLACNSMKPPAGDVVAGTVSFMAPEMAHNALFKEKRVSVGAAGDIWSLGIVLFSIFTQRNPYPNGTHAAPGGHQRSKTEGETIDGASNSNSRAGSHYATSVAPSRGPSSVTSGKSTQKAINEKLLRRVAAAEWEWPVGCSISTELRQLVEGILVKNADQRPTIQQILSNKIWSLRRRAAPPAVTAFLGVQDDFFLSRSEEQLLQAVKERSAGVAASLMQSRAQSPEHSIDDIDALDDVSYNRKRITAAEEARRRRLEQEEERRNSLKIVAREEGGVAAVQVYDVRASVRKKSRPIRDISQAIADEMAQKKGTGDGATGTTISETEKSSEGPKGKGASTRSKSRRANSSAVAKSVPTSRAGSRAGNASTTRSKQGGAAAGVIQDEDDAEVVDHLMKVEEGEEEKPIGLHGTVTPPRQLQGSHAITGTDADAREPHHRSLSERRDGEHTRSNAGRLDTTTTAGSQSNNVSAANALGEETMEEASGQTRFLRGLEKSLHGVETEDEEETKAARLLSITSKSTRARSNGVVPKSQPRREGSEDLLCNGEEAARDGDTATAARHCKADGMMKKSKELIAKVERDIEQKEEEEEEGKVAQREQPSKSVSRRRGRDASSSLRQPSSSLLTGVERNGTRTGAVTVLAPVSKPASRAASTSSRTNKKAGERAVAAAAAAVVEDTIATQVLEEPVEKRFRRERSATPPPEPPAVDDAVVLRLVAQGEAVRRALLANTLLIEHEWLLASFRLTIEEDQERYNITWLAEEQAKSASHPHIFKEMHEVTSQKYRYGYVCDSCDYEWLPTTRGGRKYLFFFHCSCGRDLCPDCYKQYEKECTCKCCNTVHPNPRALYEHVMGAPGQSKSKHTKTSAAPTAKKTGAKQAFASAVHLKRTGNNARGSRGEDIALDADDFDDYGVHASTGTAQNAAKHSAASAVVAIEKASRKVSPSGTRGSARAPSAAIATAYVPPASSSSSLSSKAAHRGAGSTAHTKMSVAAMQQEVVATSLASPREMMGSFDKPINALPEGPWRPFAKIRRERVSETAFMPTPEEQQALLSGEWIRHFYLYPPTSIPTNDDDPNGPFALAYHAQPGRTGAVFLTSDFPMHSAVFSLLERQFFVVDHVDTLEGEDRTRATSLLKAKAHPALGGAYQALQGIVAYDTNMMKQRRAPGTVSVYQAPRSSYRSNNDPVLYVRWFRFSEDRSLSAFLLSNGAVQVFVNDEFELRWFDETRKFLVRSNGVCELVNDSTFALAPAVNHLLYDSF